MSESESLTVALAEYAALRQEIDARATRHHAILTTQLFTAGAIFGYALSSGGRSLVLLIVPITSFLLLGRFADQFHAISHIGRFMREDLSGRIPGGLAWDHWIKANPRQRHWSVWTFPILLGFVGASVLALAGSFTAVIQLIGATRVAYFVAWGFGVLLTLVSIWIVFRLLMDFRGSFWGGISPRVAPTPRESSDDANHAQRAEGPLDN